MRPPRLGLQTLPNDGGILARNGRQNPRQLIDRRGGRVHHPHRPSVPAFAQPPCGQCGQHARTQQRRLARPGITAHQQHPRMIQPTDQLPHQLRGQILPPVEHLRLILLKRRQALIRTHVRPWIRALTEVGLSHRRGRKGTCLPQPPPPRGFLQEVLARLQRINAAPASRDHHPDKRSECLIRMGETHA